MKDHKARKDVGNKCIECGKPCKEEMCSRCYMKSPYIGNGIDMRTMPKVRNKIMNK